MLIDWEFWFLFVYEYFIFGKSLIADFKYYMKAAEDTDFKGLDKRNWVILQLMEKYKDNEKVTNLLKDYKELVFATIELLLKKL